MRRSQGEALAGNFFNASAPNCGRGDSGDDAATTDILESRGDADPPDIGDETELTAVLMPLLDV
jgi:hypothetical protein